MASETKRILLVDDDRNFLRVLNYHVEDLGFHTVAVSSPRRALQSLLEHEIDLVVSDLRMPEMDGIELLKEIKKKIPDLPVIVLTAHGSIDRAVEAIKNGAFDFLTKPFEKEEVLQTIKNALRMHDLVEENRRLSEAVRKRFEFEGIVGSSKAFREVLEMAEQLSDVDTTVLIQGESGTGKELLARAIHFNSKRRNRPFIVVNCGAIPRDLVESELFGYRKGAFTGATTDKKGKFEIADTGSLLLDEVGELPIEVQVKLLRVLQQREIDVLGQPASKSVDVRILAATNRNLQELIREGRFREDLYYRLSVAPLIIPPLRERREDIPLLAHHLLSELQERLSKRVQMTDRALEAMQAYDWPGNVRELENIIERLVVFNKSGEIGESDLPASLRQEMTNLGQVVIRLPEEGLVLEDLERDLIKAALEKHAWNQTHAARYLGLTRNTLIYRMQKYNLRNDREIEKEESRL